VNRMMSLRLYEQRVSELKAHVDTETSRLQAETARLLDVERQHGDAVRAVDEANERAAVAQQDLEGLRQTVADLTRLLEEERARASAAERGSFTVKAISERFDRLEEIVAENAGPAGDAVPEAKPSRRKAVAAEVAA
jgi:Fic family protein